MARVCLTEGSCFTYTQRAAREPHAVGYIPEKKGTLSEDPIMCLFFWEGAGWCRLGGGAAVSQLHEWAGVYVALG